MESWEGEVMGAGEPLGGHWSSGLFHPVPGEWGVVSDLRCTEGSAGGEVSAWLGVLPDLQTQRGQASR